MQGKMWLVGVTASFFRMESRVVIWALNWIQHYSAASRQFLTGQDEPCVMPAYLFLKLFKAHFTSPRQCEQAVNTVLQMITLDSADGEQVSKRMPCPTST